MQASLESKQKFLRAQILQSGIDAQSFMAFMGTIKEQGESINLEKWSIQQLKQVVQTFRKYLQLQINRVQKQTSTLKNTKIQTAGKVNDVSKIQKVYYDRNDLWDEQICVQKDCKKTIRFIQLQEKPEIGYKSWQVKKSGGFVFGIGSRYQIQIKFFTNFTSDAIVRKSEDVDWLRQTLCSKYPGSYIPPLQWSKAVEPEDKVGIMKRIKQIIIFLNSIINFEHLVQNIYFYTFISEKDYKNFDMFKEKQPLTKNSINLSSIQNPQGKFQLQISKRSLNFIKEAQLFARINDQIYTSLQTNIMSMSQTLQNLSKNAYSISNDFGKMTEKFNKMSQKCWINKSQTGQRMGSCLEFINNMFIKLGQQCKKQIVLMKDIQDFLKYTHSEWTQFMLLQKRFNNEMNDYLTFKQNLLKKKLKNLPDLSKWKLDEKEQSRMKLETMQKMFPQQTKIQNQARILHAYKNAMFEKSFKILINQQQKQFIKNFGKLCAKLENITQEQQMVYYKFKQIFA